MNQEKINVVRNELEELNKLTNKEGLDLDNGANIPLERKLEKKAASKQIAAAIAKALQIKPENVTNEDVDKFAEKTPDLPQSRAVIEDKEEEVHASEVDLKHQAEALAEDEGKSEHRVVEATPGLSEGMGKAPLNDAEEVDPRKGRAIDMHGYIESQKKKEAENAETLNSIEKDLESQKQFLGKSTEEDLNDVSGNKVESNEVFSGSRDKEEPILPKGIDKKFLKVKDDFYWPHNPKAAAFHDKGNRLETKSTNETVVETMVKIAEARGWSDIKVKGSENFKKEVWLEAAKRGISTKGYTPSEIDKAQLDHYMQNKKETSVGKTDALEALKNKKPEQAVKAHPELAPTLAAVAALEKKVVSGKLPLDAQKKVMARINENASKSFENGQNPTVKVVGTSVNDKKQNQEQDLER